MGLKNQLDFDYLVWNVHGPCPFSFLVSMSILFFMSVFMKHDMSRNTNMNMKISINMRMQELYMCINVYIYTQT
jgi:hypothetical protein